MSVFCISLSHATIHCAPQGISRSLMRLYTVRPNLYYTYLPLAHAQQEEAISVCNKRICVLYAVCNKRFCVLYVLAVGQAQEEAAVDEHAQGPRTAQDNIHADRVPATYAAHTNEGTCVSDTKICS